MEDNQENALLRIKKVSHWFGHHKVLFDVNLRVYRGQVLALVGPSGCGKSTLLNAIVGTLNPAQGAILMNGPDGLIKVNGPGRDRGIVYQRYTLYPFLTAVQNVAFGLMVDSCSLTYRLLAYPWWKKLQKEQLEQAAGLLKKLGLEKALNLYPCEMSGGMCQRVAVAQALIMTPRILLLDEPFGALDESTRDDLRWMMRGLSTENRAALEKGQPPPYTIIIVTHEINEGLFVSDRLVGLSQYWDWNAAGFSECPGATVVYDQPSPVYELKERQDFELFKYQKEVIVKFVFEANYIQPRWQYVQELERFPEEKGCAGE